MTRVEVRADAETVTAARDGDREALDRLVGAYLPLLYNVVGRALDGHADVDDVVQETLLRAIRALGDLRNPASFRSWLVAIAMRQVRDHRRVHRPAVTLEQTEDVVDPAADFVGTTIARLALSGERRDVAEATRWLDPGDRHVLSLWWLEVTGDLTRSELAEALDIAPRHAAVRVARMRAQLDAARALVRAMRVTPRCEQLTALVGGWDGRPQPLWRKRLSRHTRQCGNCAQCWSGLAPADRLLAGLNLVPVPATLAATGLLDALLGAASAPASAAAGAAVGTAAASAGAGKALGAAMAGPPGAAARWAGRLPRLLAAHRISGSFAAAVVAGTLTVTMAGPDHSPPPRSLPRLSAGRGPTATSATGAAPAGTPARAVVPNVANGSVRRAPAAGRPGRSAGLPALVAVPPGLLPGPLPRRPAGVLVAAASSVVAGVVNGLPDTWVLAHAGDSVTLRGSGYVRVQWDIVTSGPAGPLAMPTWTGGTVVHVASGGGRRLDDPVGGVTALAGDSLPTGVGPIWRDEFYYLDGTVTLRNNSGTASYRLDVTPVTWAQIDADLRQPPDPARGILRYGIVRDTGGGTPSPPGRITTAVPALTPVG
jgi:RNA polymerase sigma factor (sigma-70 family)